MLYTDEKEHALYNDYTRATASINNTKSTGMLDVKDSTVRYAGLSESLSSSLRHWRRGVIAY